MIPLLFALLLAQDTVEGTVLNALTNESLRKADVTLVRGKKTYAAISSTDGKFRFEAIDPGEYQLRVQRQGFLDADDEPEVEVTSGQEVKDIVIKLTPQGIIAGRVVDEDGDPVEEASVFIERSMQVNGRKISLSSDQSETNSEGYFFIGGLKPGPYHLSAAPPNSRMRFERPVNSGPRESLVRTEELAPIQLAPGAAMRGVEIKLRKSPIFRVRGRLSNSPKDYRNLWLTGESQSHSATIRDGAFVFNGVTAGSYTLTQSDTLAQRADGAFAPPSMYCHVPITVSDRDVDGVVVELAPGPDIEGLIRIDGDGHFAKPQKLGIVGDWSPQFVTANEDGTFRWTNLVPQVHFLNYAPPDGSYAKSIQFNHQPVKNRVIDLTSGSAGTLEIVVAPNAATISATVPGAKNATVALWNDSTSDAQQPDATGVVTFKSLAPGEYRIAAWQNIDRQYLNIPEFRALFDARKITLTEGSHETVELKPIPKSASDAEIAKLQ